MSKSTGRTVTATILAVLVAVLAIPSVLLVWVNRDVLNADRYVATVAPLAGDPDVQTAVTTRVTTEVMSHLDLSSLLTSMTADLPPTATRGLLALEGPIESALQTFVQNTVQSVVSSGTFAQIWTDANRAAHAGFLAVLTGQGERGIVGTSGDSITIDIGPIVAAAKNRLVAAGFQLAERIPAVQTQYTVVTSPSIGKAQQWFGIFQVLRWAVPVLAAVLLLIALLLSPNRLRTLLITALGIVVAMILLGAATFAARAIVAPNTAGTVYDTLVGPLRTDIRWALGIALIVAGLTWLYRYLRPSRPVEAEAS